ncbi:hypothetical protein FB451DRAFT_1195728 [Mycena latifolia]|nr:hypothetical protein FB451DRAFT_1195728 [Mycena latifolia]
MPAAALVTHQESEPVSEHFKAAPDALISGSIKYFAAAPDLAPIEAAETMSVQASNVHSPSPISDSYERCEGCTRVACALAPLHPQNKTNHLIWKCQESAYGNFSNHAGSLTTTRTTSTPDDDGPLRSTTHPHLRSHLWHPSTPALSPSRVTTRGLHPRFYGISPQPGPVSRHSGHPLFRPNFGLRWLSLTAEGRPAPFWALARMSVGCAIKCLSLEEHITGPPSICPKVLWTAPRPRVLVHRLSSAVPLTARISHSQSGPLSTHMPALAKHLSGFPASLF